MQYGKSGSGSRRSDGGSKDPDRWIAWYVEQELETWHIDWIVETFHADDPTTKDTFGKRGSNSTEAMKPRLEFLETPTLIVTVGDVHVAAARPVHEGLTAPSEHRNILGQHLIRMLRIGEITHYVGDQGHTFDFAFVEQLDTAAYHGERCRFQLFIDDTQESRSTDRLFVENGRGCNHAWQPWKPCTISCHAVDLSAQMTASTVQPCRFVQRHQCPEKVSAEQIDISERRYVRLKSAIEFDAFGLDQIGASSLRLRTLEQNSRWRQLRQVHGQSIFSGLPRWRNAVSARVLSAISCAPSSCGLAHSKGTSLSEAAKCVIGPCASGGPADVITRLLADLSEHVGSNSLWRTWAGVAILPWADPHVARLHPAHGQSELRDQSPITLRPPVNSNRTSPPDDARGRRHFGVLSPPLRGSEHVLRTLSRPSSQFRAIQV